MVRTNLFLLFNYRCHRTNADFLFRDTVTETLSNLLENTENTFSTVTSSSLNHLQFYQGVANQTCVFLQLSHYKQRTVLHFLKTARSTRPLSMSGFNYCWLPQTCKQYNGSNTTLAILQLTELTFF